MPYNNWKEERLFFKSRRKYPKTALSIASSHSLPVRVTSREVKLLIVPNIHSTLLFEMGAYANLVRHSVPRCFMKSRNKRAEKHVLFYLITVFGASKV